MELQLTLTNILIGLLGILIYSVFKARTYMINGTFNWSKFVKEGLPTWLWALSLIVLIALIMQLVPEASDAIQTITGFAINEGKAAFLTLGATLAGLTRNMTKSSFTKDDGINPPDNGDGI